MNAKTSTDDATLRIRGPEKGVLALTLNDTKSRNALSLGLIRQLRGTLNTAGADPAIRVVVLGATGPVFSSGHDLKELTAHRADPDKGVRFFRMLFNQCGALMTEIARLPKPVIAAVRGTATAAGCQLVAACDLAVAAKSATFATPGVDIGLFCASPAVAISRNVGAKRAMEMLLTADKLTAAEALQAGLINRVVDDKELDAAVAELAARIAAKSAAAIRFGKAAFHRQRNMDLDKAYGLMARVMTANMLHADAGEGITAFLEKRVPKWANQ
ncbi:MAG TPA: enoyl-CoA hydratase [Micropepsaceae bacterium]|nr:enoyl-CoA hydratase [Micropepsaceae bacterium]